MVYNFELRIALCAELVWLSDICIAIIAIIGPLRRTYLIYHQNARAVKQFRTHRYNIHMEIVFDFLRRHYSNPRTYMMDIRPNITHKPSPWKVRPEGCLRRGLGTDSDHLA